MANLGRIYSSNITLRAVFCAVLVVFILAFSNVTVVHAQPGLNDPWQPPSTCPPGMYCLVGPIGPGQSFIVYFEDRNYNRKDSVLDTDLPVYMVITTPPGLTGNTAWAIQYYPPGYQIASWLFSGQNLGPSGTFTLGPYSTSPGDPFGSYAFRIGLLSVDSSGTVYWTNQVVYLDLEKYIPPPPPPSTISTSSQVSVPQSQVNPGQQVVVSASVSPAPTGGTLSLSVSESGGQWAVLNSAQASTGTVSVSWSPPGPGTYSFKATFSGYTDTAANKIYSQSESVPASLTVQLMQTTLMLSASPTSTDIDALTGSTGTITITGTLSPQVAGASVLLTYSTPSGNTLKPVVVGPGGIFMDSLTPTKPGIYTVSAQYQGDQTHQPSTSQSVVVTVGQNWMTAIAIGVVVAAAIIIVAVVFLRRRRTT